VELIDYKSAGALPEPAEIDLQLNLALEQVYQQSLRRLSFIYLRQISFDVTPELKEQLQDTMESWQCGCGLMRTGNQHLGNRAIAVDIALSGYGGQPEPLPLTAKPAPQVQLVPSL